MRTKQLRRRCLAVVAAVTVASSVGAAAIDLNSAYALGTTHHLVAASKQKFSLGVGRPNIAFTCNDATGAFTLKAKNVQVILYDHVTEWSHLDLQVLIDYPGDHVFIPIIGPLVQNNTNGLFGMNVTGTLPVSSNNGDPGSVACKTGNKVTIDNFDDGASLLYTWNLS